MRALLGLLLSALIVCPALAQTVSPPAGGGGGSGTVTSVTCNSGLTGGTFTTTGTCALDQTFAPTWTGEHIFNKTAAASTPGVLLNGTLFTGGTGTTTFPYLYINQGAAAPTDFSTAGTMLGMNAPSGFTGNFMWLELNGGGIVLDITSGGNVNSIGTSTFSAQVATGSLTFDSTGGAGATFTNGGAGMIETATQFTSGSFTGTGLGTSPTFNWGNGTFDFDVSVGTSPAAATWTITLPTAAHGWACDASDITTTSTSNFITKQVGGTTTTAVMESFTDVAVAGTYTAADHIRGKCAAG